VLALQIVLRRQTSHQIQTSFFNCILQAWTGPDRVEFESMAKRAKALGKPDALFRIVRDLAELSKHSSAVSERREAMPALAS
jgi:CRISPR/Cas system-associated endoribonuclease Cas2